MNGVLIIDGIITMKRTMLFLIDGKVLSSRAKKNPESEWKTYKVNPL